MTMSKAPLPLVRRVLVALVLPVANLVFPAPAAAADEPWAKDPVVQQVLEIRKQGIAAMTTTGPTAASERYSSTFVANTPGNAVVKGDQMLALFGKGTLGYAAVEQHIDYAAAHGPDMVVVMGEEIVVPRAGSANAGKRIHRRFTDVFRKENGEWRYDLRHANVVSIE